MTTANKEVSRRFIEEVWNAGNFALIEELVDPSYEAHDPVFGTYKRDGLRPAIESYRRAFPDLKLEIVNLVGDDKFVAMRWLARGTHLGTFMGLEPTRKTALVSGIALSELKDGKIVKDYNEYDALGLLRQLGATEKLMVEPPRTTTRPEKRT